MTVHSVPEETMKDRTKETAAEQKLEHVNIGKSKAGFKKYAKQFSGKVAGKK